MTYNSKKRAKIIHRLFTGMLLFCFISTSLHAEIIQQKAGISVRPPRTESPRLPALAETIQIPENFGNVKERFVPDISGAPTLIHIQDAHGSLEAQKNISRILQHLNQNYGADLFFLEGGLGEIQTERLRFFENPESNHKVEEVLLQHAIIGGVELSMLELERAGHKVPAYGMEDAALYRKNLSDFREVLSHKAVSIHYTDQLRSEIRTESSRVFNKALKTFFEEWTVSQSNPQEMTRHLKTLTEHALKDAGIDFRDPVSQMDWPQLVRLVRLQELEGKLNPAGIKADTQKLLAWMGTEKIDAPESAEFRSLLEESKVKAEHPRLSIERFYDSLKGKPFTFRDYPFLSLSLGRKILEDEIRPLELFQEMDGVSQKIFEALVKKPEEQKLIEFYKDYLAVKKLFALELTRKEYSVLKSRHFDLKPSAFQKRLNQPGDSKQLSDLDAIFEKAEAFYEDAIAREAAMMKTMVERMKQKPGSVSVFLTGGFHSEGLSRKIKEKGAAYVEIMPRITDLKDENGYMNLMMLQGAPGKVSHAHQAVYAGSDFESLGEPVAPFIKSEIRRLLQENFPGEKASLTQKRSETRKDEAPTVIGVIPFEDRLAAVRMAASSEHLAQAESFALNFPGLKLKPVESQPGVGGSPVFEFSPNEILYRPDLAAAKNENQELPLLWVYRGAEIEMATGTHKMMFQPVNQALRANVEHLTEISVKDYLRNPFLKVVVPGRSESRVDPQGFRLIDWNVLEKREILKALLKAPNVTGAAELLNVSPKHVYNILKDQYADLPKNGELSALRGSLLERWGEYFGDQPPQILEDLTVTPLNALEAKWYAAALIYHKGNLEETAEGIQPSVALKTVYNKIKAHNIDLEAIRKGDLQVDLGMLEDVGDKIFSRSHASYADASHWREKVEKILLLKDDWRLLLARDTDEALKNRSLELRKKLSGRDVDWTYREVGYAIALYSEAVRRIIDENSNGKKTIHREVLSHIGGPPNEKQIEGALYLLGSRQFLTMAPSEGKTLTVGLAAYLKALDGVKTEVHDRGTLLTARDAQAEGAILERLGMRVAAVFPQGGSDFTKTINLKGDFPHLVKIRPETGIPFPFFNTVQNAFQADVIYGPHDTMMFLWMFDWFNFGPQYGKVHGLNDRVWLFVEEADEVLLDENNDPLIVLADGKYKNSKLETFYRKVYEFSKTLVKDTDYRIAANRIEFAPEKINFLIAGLKTQIENIPDIRILLRGENLEDKLRAALEAQSFYRKDRDYFVMNRMSRMSRGNKMIGTIVIRDQHTGELKPDRRWGRGIHAFIEIKENLPLFSGEKIASLMTPLRFYQNAAEWSAVTGVLDAESRLEMETLYGVQIHELSRKYPSLRRDLNDVYYWTKREKMDAIVRAVRTAHKTGRPILINVKSPEEAYELKASLEASNQTTGFLRDGRSLKIIDGKNPKEDIPNWKTIGSSFRITIAAQMANRGTEIKLEEYLYQDEPANKVMIEGQEMQIAGLFVIGTYQSAPPRVKRQLRDRAARRGHPGVTWIVDHVEENEFLQEYASKELSILLSKNKESLPDATHAELLFKIANERRRQDHMIGLYAGIPWYESLVNAQLDMIDIASRSEENGIGKLEELENLRFRWLTWAFLAFQRKDQKTFNELHDLVEHWINETNTVFDKRTEKEEIPEKFDAVTEEFDQAMTKLASQTHELRRSETRAENRDEKSFADLLAQVRSVTTMNELVEAEAALLRHPESQLKPIGSQPGIDKPVFDLMKTEVLYRGDLLPDDHSTPTLPLLWKYVGKTRSGNIAVQTLNPTELRKTYSADWLAVIPADYFAKMVAENKIYLLKHRRSENRTEITHQQAEAFTRDVSELYYLLDSAFGEENINRKVLSSVLLWVQNPSRLIPAEIQHSEDLVDWADYMRTRHAVILNDMQIMDEPDYSELVFSPDEEEGGEEGMLILGDSGSGKSSLAVALQKMDYSLGGESDSHYFVIKIPGYFVMAGAGKTLTQIRARAWSEHPDLEKRIVSVRKFGAKAALVNTVVILNHPMGLRFRKTSQAPVAKLESQWVNYLDDIPRLNMSGPLSKPMKVIKVTHGYEDGPGHLQLAKQLINQISVLNAERSENRKDSVKQAASSAVLSLAEIESVISETSSAAELEAGGSPQSGFAVSQKEESRIGATALMSKLNQVRDQLSPRYAATYNFKISNPNGDRKSYILEIQKRSESRAELPVSPSASAPLYIAIYKPRGVLSTRDTEALNGFKGRRSVFDMVKDFLGYLPEGLFVAGRLDFDVEGLMVMTTDGSYFSVMLPRAHIPRTYQVEFDQDFTEEQAQRLRTGVVIHTKDNSGVNMDHLTNPAISVTIVKKDNPAQVELVIAEGKYHQVKEMFKAVGVKAIRLQRSKVGSLVLRDLNIGPGSVMPLRGELLQRVLRDRDRAQDTLNEEMKTNPIGMIRQYFKLFEANEEDKVSAYGAARLLEIAKDPQYRELFWALWMDELFSDARMTDEKKFYDFFIALSKENPKVLWAALNELKKRFSAEEPPKEIVSIQDFLNRKLYVRAAGDMIYFLIKNRTYLRAPEFKEDNHSDNPREYNGMVAEQMFQNIARHFTPEAKSGEKMLEFRDPVTGRGFFNEEASEKLRRAMDRHPELFNRVGWVKVIELRRFLLPLLNHGDQRGDWGNVWNKLINRAENRSVPEEIKIQNVMPPSIAVPRWDWLRYALFFNPYALKAIQVPMLAMGIHPETLQTNMLRVAYYSDMRLRRKLGAPWFEPAGWQDLWAQVWIEEADRQKGKPEEVTALAAALFYQSPDLQAGSLYQRTTGRLSEVYPKARETYYESKGKKVFVRKVSVPFDGAPLSAYVIVPEKSMLLERIPAVTMFHGFTNRKEQPYFDSPEEMLTDLGYAVVRIDLPGHGEHFGNFFRPNAEDLNRFAEASAREIQLSSSLFPPIPGNGHEHLMTIRPEAIYGHSFGGYLTYAAFQNPEIQKSIKAFITQGAPFEDAFQHPENWLFTYWNYLKIFFESNDYNVIMAKVQKLVRNEIEIPHEHLNKLLVQIGQEDILASADYGTWHRVFEEREDHLQLYKGEKHYFLNSKEAAFRKAVEFISRRVPLPGAEESAAVGSRAESRGDSEREKEIQRKDRMLREIIHWEDGVLAGELNRLAQMISEEEGSPLYYEEIQALASIAERIDILRRQLGDTADDTEQAVKEFLPIIDSWGSEIINYLVRMDQTELFPRTYELVNALRSERRTEAGISGKISVLPRGEVSNAAIEEVYAMAGETFSLTLPAVRIEELLLLIKNREEDSQHLEKIRQVLKENLGEYAWLVERSPTSKAVQLILPVEEKTLEVKGLLSILKAIMQPKDSFYIPVIGDPAKAEVFSQAMEREAKKDPNLKKQFQNIHVLSIPEGESLRMVRRLGGNTDSFSGARGAAGEEKFLDSLGHVRELHRMKTSEELEESVIALLAAAYLREAAPEASLGVEDLAGWMKSKGIDSKDLSARVFASVQALAALESAA